MRPWVKWGIVRSGRVRWTDDFETGEEVFRDDLAFIDHRRGMIGSLRVFNWLVGLTSIIVMIGFLYSGDPFVAFLLVLFFSVLVLSVGEAYAWRSIDFGTVVYELGVLVFQIGLSGTRRVFVPFDQIREVRRSPDFIDLIVKGRLRYFRIAAEELTALGLDVLTAWMRGERPAVVTEPPKLVLYSTSGITPGDHHPPST